MKNDAAEKGGRERRTTAEMGGGGIQAMTKTKTETEITI
jgi:hypothetical protein